MARKNERSGFGKILDAWNAPPNGGDPVGCISTTFTFHPRFFETECLGRFLGLETDAEDDGLAFLIENESRMSQLEAAVVLADQRHCTGKRSLRWDLLPARLRGRLMHAKVSVLCWERAVRVIIASANLTEDGYRRNQEVFGVLDYHEGAQAPLSALVHTVGFLRALLDTSILRPSESPAVSRSRKLLSRLEQTPGSWGLAPAEEKTVPIRVHTVFSGLGAASVLDQVSDLWPSTTPPHEARVVSPFFDTPGTGADRPTAELWTKLRRRGAASVAFCVSAETIQGEDTLLVHAPESLDRAQPARPSVSTHVRRVIDKENRPLHTKVLWLDGERHALYLIGSANFTTAGLNLSGAGNVEANLVYIVDRQSHEKEARLLEECFPSTEDLEPESFRWQESVPPEEDVVAEAIPLPDAFGQAVYDAAVNRLQLSFLAKPKVDWSVFSEDDDLIYRRAQWEEQQEPQVVNLDWKADRPPSGLWVRSVDEGTRSWWPVEVLLLEALLPPEEIRDLPLDVLIRSLTSALPLHRILAAEIRRVRERGQNAATDEVTDPHQKVDVSGFLLQRTRRVAEAIEVLRVRLSKPVTSEASLHWRIDGPVGVKRLIAALRKEARSPEEQAFLLTEFALALSRVEVETTPTGLSEERVRTALSVVIGELQAAIPRTELSAVPNLSQYVKRAFREVNRG